MQNTAEARTEEIEREHRALCAGYGRLLALVAAADERQDGLLLGHGGTVSLLAKHLRVTRTVATGMVNEARALRRCPNTRTALEEGHISPRHLSQILAGVKATAHLVDGPRRAEEILLALALNQDAAAVKSAVAGIKQVLDPVGTEKEHQAKRQRSVCYLSPLLDGTWALSGTLDPESGAMLATALDALATGYLPRDGEGASATPPRPERSSTPDSAPALTASQANASSPHPGTTPSTRPPIHLVREPSTPPIPKPVNAFSSSSISEPTRLTGPQRRALALTDLAARSLTAGEVGVHGGTRPHLSVLIPESVLPASHQSDRHTNHTPARTHLSAVSPSSALAATPATDPGTSATTTTLVAGPTATTSSASLDVATTAYGHDLPPSTAQRLACDCALTPIRIDGDGQPLNVGRTQRLATTAQRKALAVRGRGCVHPNCRIGPQWCDAHHIISWLDGGQTDLANLVLLCRRHHTEIHYQQRLAALEPAPDLPNPAIPTSPPLALAS